MPRFWLFNCDELVSRKDMHYGPVFIRKILKILPRFLFCLKPGDGVLVFFPIPRDFLRYACAVKGLDSIQFSRLRWPSGRRSLIEAVLADRRLLSRLKSLGSGWTLEPFVESARVVKLSRASGLRTGKSDYRRMLDGTTLMLNDKGLFKALARLLGLETVPGYLADSRETLEAAIAKVSEENKDRVMLRKTRYAGGLGNLAGDRKALLARLPSWYNRGEVLVEHFLELEQTAGSLVTLTRDGARFEGVDVQRIKDGCWTGFDYPHPDAELTRRIRELSLRFAKALRSRNVMGDVNLDWGVVNGRPLALECNLRHNGFGFLMRFARDYFGPRAEGLRIRYMEDFPLRTGVGSLKKLELALKDEPGFIRRPGAERGAVVMTPPRRSGCTLALFGESAEYIDGLETRLRRRLS